MKKFSVGLPVTKKTGFIEKIIEHRESISEVYFSFGKFPNGRSMLTDGDNDSPFESMLNQSNALDKLHENGLSFNLLFNANCYGSESLSKSLFYKIGDTIDYLKNKYRLLSVTTTSPLIAKFIKSNFDDIKTRASVNMEIGTQEGMEYVMEYFDGFYLKREYNKNLSAIKKARAWCDENGKELYLLANSGCLNYCSAHNFHDNLVAHEAEIAKYDNAYVFEGVCRNYLKNSPEKFLQRTNFIRPEDIHLVEEYFDGIKLATRINPNPSVILDAYVRGKYSGSAPSLLEPDHTALFYPKIIDSGKIADNYLETVLNCDKNCSKCNFCVETLKNAMISLEDI